MDRLPAYGASTTARPPFAFTNLPDDMIREVCNRMGIRELKRLVITGRGPRKLCMGILVEKQVALLKGIRTSTPSEAWASFEQAVKHDNIAVVEAMLDLGKISPNATQDGITALYVATEHSRHDIMKLLLRYGASVNAANGRKGFTALHLAATIGDTEALKVLVGADANVNAVDLTGDTPLHLAAANGNYGFVYMLLAAGANKNATNVYRSTPLDKAQSGPMTQAHTDVAELLRNWGLPKHKNTSCILM